MSEYTNEQLHEAYSIEHYAHKQTQERFNNEVKQHALTRRKLLELQDNLKDVYQIREIDDTWRNVICDTMEAYGDEYNDNDFSMFFNCNHTNIGAFNNGALVAFGCVLHLEDSSYMCYSWNDNTYQGKKGYIKGIRYLMERFPNIVFDDYGQQIMEKRQ